MTVGVTNDGEEVNICICSSETCSSLHIGDRSTAYFCIVDQKQSDTNLRCFSSLGARARTARSFPSPPSPSRSYLWDWKRSFWTSCAILWTRANPLRRSRSVGCWMLQGIGWENGIEKREREREREKEREDGGKALAWNGTYKVFLKFMKPAAQRTAICSSEGVKPVNRVWGSFMHFDAVSTLQVRQGDRGGLGHMYVHSIQGASNANTGPNRVTINSQITSHLVHDW